MDARLPRRLRRRHFLKLPVACLPGGSAADGCRILGAGGLALPYYPLETRVPGSSFEASFEVENVTSSLKWFEEASAILWCRGRNGSTEIVVSMPLFVGLTLKAHFVSEVDRKLLTGFATLEGALSDVFSSGPRLEDGRVLVNENPFEEMPLRASDREDGSRRSGVQIPIRNIARWTFEDLIEEPTARDVLEIGDNSWPTTRYSFHSPDRLGFLYVWVSEDLGIVLKEELHTDRGLEREFRAVSLTRGVEVAVPSVAMRVRQ